MSLRATVSSGPEVLAGLNTDGSNVSWMEIHWPFISWAIFLFGAGMLAANYRVRNQYWYGWLSLVMYCLHQSEEHAYDLRGWRYAFVPSLNHGPISEIFKDVCGANSASCPLDPKITLYVNIVLIWFGFGGCMVAATFAPRRFLLAGSLNWGTAVVNGLMGHILPAYLTSSYNPGVVQSIVMVPLGIRVILRSGRPLLCIANGIVSHAALILGINFLFRFHTDEALTMSIFIGIAGFVVPLIISNTVSNSHVLFNKKTG